MPYERDSTLKESSTAGSEDRIREIHISPHRKIIMSMFVAFFLAIGAGWWMFGDDLLIRHHFNRLMHKDLECPSAWRKFDRRKEKVVTFAEQKFASGTRDERYVAIKILSRLLKDDSIPYLESVILEEERILGSLAAGLMLDIRTVRSLSAFMALLDNESTDVRWAAYYAGIISQHEIRSVALFKALNDNEETILRLALNILSARRNHEFPDGMPEAFLNRLMSIFREQEDRGILRTVAKILAAEGVDAGYDYLERRLAESVDEEDLQKVGNYAYIIAEVKGLACMPLFLDLAERLAYENRWPFVDAAKKLSGEHLFEWDDVLAWYNRKPMDIGGSNPGEN